MLINKRLDIDMQNIANLLSNFGSSRSIENIPSLSKIIKSGIYGNVVFISIAFKPLVHLPALTGNFDPNR